MEPKDRIIVAADVKTVSEAIELVDEVGPHVGGVKIGLQLQRALLHALLSGGHEARRARDLWTALAGQIVLDGKDHDIPNTMGGAAEQNAALGVLAYTVHACAGHAGMRASVAARGEAKVLAVTVLTSHGTDECVSIFGDNPGEKVPQFAAMAAEAGVQGIVCSPADMAAIKESGKVPPSIEFWTPAIRPRWAAKDDQARITTPADAVRAGVTRLIIGRPIRIPPEEIGSRAEAAKRIADEIASAH